MTWEHRGELRADPGIAPGHRNINPPKRRSIWPSIAVAAAAATFGGVIWFAYQDGRDASRAAMPPLVRADAGPVKVKPDNPGGQEIPFQDSTVYDRLNPNGQKPVVEKLLPPPEEPVARPQAAEVPAEAPVQAADGRATDVQSPGAAPPAAAPQNAPPADAGGPTALAPSPGAIVIEPPAAAPPRDAPAPKPVAAAPAKPEIAKPAPPTSIAALIEQAATAPAAPRTVAGDGYRLQLSAVRSPEAAPEEWARLKRRYPELAALKNSTSKIDVPGKGAFYRVEAGPLDEAAAKSTCAHLREQGLGCIVIKH